MILWLISAAVLVLITPSRKPTVTVLSRSRPTITPTSSGRTVTIISDDLCYESPGDKYEVASAVRKDRVLELLGRGDGGEYYVVVNPIHAGACWVGIRSVNFSGDPGSLRIIPVPTAIPILPLAPGTAPGLDILFRLPPLLPQF